MLPHQRVNPPTNKTTQLSYDPTQVIKPSTYLPNSYHLTHTYIKPNLTGLNPNNNHGTDSIGYPLGTHVGSLFCGMREIPMWLTVEAHHV